MPLDERIAGNAALMRALNEEIRGVEESWAAPPGSYVGFVCECATTGCRANVAATIAEYREIASARARRLIAPGHAPGERERVVFSNERFLVVEPAA